MSDQKIKKSKSMKCWLKQFSKIWNDLPTTKRQTLCSRFGILGNMDITLKDIASAAYLPIPPRAFVIATLHLANINNPKLIEMNPYDELWMEKISYDRDKWGSLRSVRRYFGLLEHNSLLLSKKKRKYFETLLISSVSLDKDEKLKVISAIPTLSKFQINKLMKVWEEEAIEFSKLYLKHADDVVKLVKKAEKEWREITPMLDHYQSSKGEVDKYYHLTPVSIAKAIKKSVKGQKHAVREIAKQLYYQYKVRHFYKINVDMPSLDPLLLIGSTGSGKSFLLQRGCDTIGIPFMHVDCSSLVSAGIKGYSVQSIIKDLLRKTNYNIKDAETAIVILDEVDKLLSHHDGRSIFDQLLRFVEGSTIAIEKSSYAEEKEFKKIDSISTEKMFFIFAGSFQYYINRKQKQSGFIKNTKNKESITIDDIEKTDIPKELLGRIVDIVELKKLRKKDYKKILLKGEHSPIKKYQKMLEINDISFQLTSKQINEIIEKSSHKEYGARSLNQIVKPYFDEILFKGPGDKTP